MTKQKKIEKEVVVMHQHRNYQDYLGWFCGRLHPILAEHKKESTQKRHDSTIKGS